ncbi:hypothetical protein P8452_58995 [Trifolium repens]|nr:hypothetical protein P8452_58995 [Trifolium repens]
MEFGNLNSLKNVVRDYIEAFDYVKRDFGVHIGHTTLQFLRASCSFVFVYCVHLEEAKLLNLLLYPSML